MLHWPTGHRVRLSAGHSLQAGKAAVLDNEGRYGMTWREEERPQGQQLGSQGQGTGRNAVLLGCQPQTH